jgi:hypothetical protein|uniref:Uncharacterized protein n=1 Tax=viral metagenome TaxID=1070528 RepID=A0A6C0LWW2_9ZZZZ
MSEYYNNILTDDLTNSVIKEYLNEQKNIKEHNEIFEDYNNYIASFEYEKALRIESICEDVEAYDLARGNYYELILFNINEFIQSFNYKKYIYLRFYNNIKSDVYYSTNINDSVELNISNLAYAINEPSYLSIFNNNYKSAETYKKLYKIIIKRIEETFIFTNYYRNSIKQSYTYKSNIYNYLIKDMIYDYANILDELIVLSPCECDDIFLNNSSIYNIITDIEIVDSIANSIYSINFETFVELSFIIKHYSEYFSRDGVKTLNTFYTDKMSSLVIPELYKIFLSNIKNSKKIYDLYEKTKYVYSIEMKEELNYLSKDLCSNISGLIFICKCNYVYKLWRMIFNNNKHYYHYYPEKEIKKINEYIISKYNMEKLI